MKVRLLVARTGGQNSGDEIEVSTDEAGRMIEAGQAEPVRGAKPEKAIKRFKSEQAV